MGPLPLSISSCNIILGSDRFLEPFLDCFVEKTFLCVVYYVYVGEKRVFFFFPVVLGKLNRATKAAFLSQNKNIKIKIYTVWSRDPSSSIRTCSHKQVAHNWPQSPHSFGGGS
jgi:hypothetical protein